MDLSTYNRTTYFENVKNLKSDIYKTKFDEIGSMGLLGTYMMMSANISTFLSKWKSEDHYKLIQDIQFHRTLSSLDQYYFHLLDEIKVTDNTNILEKSQDTGHIYVTYHTGSYRLFIQQLNRENIPFCLVTEGNYIKEQGEVTQKLFKKLNNNSKELEILPAENPRLIFELTKKLRQGTSVVFYIDGNKGATNKDIDDNKNLLKIDFLDNHIYARQGIAFLSYLSNAPLVTAIAKRNSDLENEIHIQPVHTANLRESESRNSFINVVTKILYYQLEELLHECPAQWEGWFYIDRFFQQNVEAEKNTAVKIDTKSSDLVTLAVDSFVHLIKHSDENMFLVSKKDYKIMKISQYLYKVLSYFKIPKAVKPNMKLTIDDNEVSWSDLEELVEMKFLKPMIA
jgi:lauroyl/myristoyl acyltransferase